MKTKGNVTWMPHKSKGPMLRNGLGRIQLGNPALLAVARWGLPWLLTAGGVALTSAVAKNSLPEIPINKNNIALASALIGAGAASYMAVEGMPENWKPWAYAAAIAGIGAGSYFLFQPMPPAPPESPASTMAREQMPSTCAVPGTPRYGENMPPSISGIRVDMDLDQDKVGGLKRNKYADQEYAFELRNLSSQPKCFFVGLNIKDDNGDPMTSLDDQTFPGGKSPVGPSKYGRKEVTLQPGEYRPMTLLAPGFGNAAMPFTSFNQTVGVELFRKLRDVFPFQESNTIQVNGVPPYFAGLGGTEIHDERDPRHVIGCKKCKKKKNGQQVNLPGMDTIPTRAAR